MDSLEAKLKTIITEKETKLLPENLKKGVTLLGVEGGLESGLTEYTFQDSVLTLNNTIKNGTIRNFTVAGRSRQAGTPSFDNTVPVKNQIAGNTYTVIIRNSNNTQSQTFPLQLTHTIKGRSSVRDTFLEDGLHIRMGEETFDGSEDEVWKIWTLNNDTVERFYINSDKLLFGASSMCDKLVFTDNNGANEHFRASANTMADGTRKYNQVVVFINKSRLSEVSIAGFKAYLAENPLTFTAALQEEIILPYDAAQQGWYDALKKAVTYEGVTNITTSHGNEGPMLSGKYYAIEKAVGEFDEYEDYDICNNLAGLVLGETPLIDDPNVRVTLNVSNDNTITVEDTSLVIEEVVE